MSPHQIMEQLSVFSARAFKSQNVVISALTCRTSSSSETFHRHCPKLRLETQIQAPGPIPHSRNAESSEHEQLLIVSLLPSHRCVQQQMCLQTSEVLCEFLFNTACNMSLTDYHVKTNVSTECTFRDIR